MLDLSVFLLKMFPDLVFALKKMIAAFMSAQIWFQQGWQLLFKMFKFSCNSHKETLSQNLISVPIWGAMVQRLSLCHIARF